MNYFEISTDDVDELFTWGSGWEADYMQLSPGRLGFRMRVVKLPEMHLEWNTFGQRLLFREVNQSQGLLFGFTLEGTSAPRYRGRETELNDALVYHVGQEQEYVVSRGNKSLCIGLKAKLRQRLGWDLHCTPVCRVPQESLDELRRRCWLVTVRARQASTALPFVYQNAVQDWILTALRDVLTPWFTTEMQAANHWLIGNRSHQLVKRAEALMDHLSPGQKLNVSEIASELEVSQRSLYLAFQNGFGIGPYEYFMLRKLHSFRDRLIAGKPFHGKVTQSAHDAGFQHLGRLTQMYRSHFGETPRETMKSTVTYPRFLCDSE